MTVACLIAQILNKYVFLCMILHKPIKDNQFVMFSAGGLDRTINASRSMRFVALLLSKIVHKLRTLVYQLVIIEYW